MNRKTRAVAAALAVLAVTALCLETQAETILRLHVVAHSDSAEDQRVKLLVRDAVLKVQQETAADCTDAAAARDAVMSHGKQLLAAAEAVLQEEGTAYGAQLYLGTYAFPEKAYAGEVYPAGDYQALRVVLGSGQGQNWWCVMFPPLCLIALDKEQELEIDRARGQVHFKSILVELFQKWLKGETS